MIKVAGIVHVDFSLVGRFVGLGISREEDLQALFFNADDHLFPECPKCLGDFVHLRLAG